MVLAHVVFLFILWCIAWCQNESFLLPQGTGPYYTSLTSEEWIDESRLDPFNSSHLRRIMVSRFNPVAPSHCRHIKVPYMTAATAAVEDEILGEFDYPKGLWSRFFHNACEDKRPRKRDGEGQKGWPLVLFSGGLNTTRLFYSHFAQEMSSHGFTVITMDHPYDTDVVEFPNGDVILGGRVVKPANANGSTASIEHALEVRAADASFVLNHLGVKKTDQVLMFGHSLGGSASATTLLNDKRFRAGVNLDGPMFGPVVNTSLGTPRRQQAFMLWGADGHNSSTDPAWTQFWASLNGSTNVDYRKEFNIAKSTHGSYWDVNILVDIAGMRDGLSERAKLLVSPIPGHRVWRIMGRYLLAFFWFTLGEKSEDSILVKPSTEFPEVELVH